MSQRFTVERRPSDIQGEVNQLFEGDEPASGGGGSGGGGGNVDGGGDGGAAEAAGAARAEVEVAEVVVVLKGRQTVYRRPSSPQPPQTRVVSAFSVSYCCMLCLCVT